MSAPDNAPFEVSDDRLFAEQQTSGPGQGVDGEQAEHLWTWRLAEAGFSLDECIAIRRLTQDEVLEQLTQAAIEGRPIDLRSLLGEQLLGEAEQLWREREPGPLPGLYRRGAGPLRAVSRFA